MGVSRGEYDDKLPDFFSWMLKLGVFLAGGTLTAPPFLTVLALLLSEVCLGLMLAELDAMAIDAGLPLVAVRLAERLR